MNEMLAIFGFAWMTVSGIFGLYMGVKHERLAGTLEQLAESGRLLDYHREQSAFRWGITAHAHGFLFSLVCIAVALWMPSMSYSATAGGVLAAALMTATALWWLAAVFGRNRPLMGIADFMLLGSLIAAVIGLAGSRL